MTCAGDWISNFAFSILAHLPQGIQLIFGGSGIVPAAIVAIIFNIILDVYKRQVYSNVLENFDDVEKLNVGAAIIVTGKLVASPPKSAENSVSEPLSELNKTVRP